MSRILICFFFLNAGLVYTQSSVRLVDIQSSECGGMYDVKPYFFMNEKIGDTTYISLSCSNNCGGYHDPSVSKHGDSVHITIHPGTKERMYFINNRWFDQEDLEEFGLGAYRSDSSFMKEVISRATCDCCFTFNMKILGLDSSANYQYFYNGQFIDPNYTPPPPRKYFKFPYFLDQSEEKVCNDLQRIISKRTDLYNGSYRFTLSIDLSVDTLNCRIKHVETNLGFYKNTKTIDQKIKNYFRSLSPIHCVTNPYNSKTIEDYTILLEFNEEKNEFEMSYESGERLYENY